LRGAAILAAASALNRLIGLVYMIALPRLISDQGMGLYQLVKPIHYFAAVVAIGGMPVAVAKLSAEKAALGQAWEVQRTFRTGLLLLLLSGGAVALALILGAPWFAAVLAKDPGVIPILVALGPACFFLALSAGFRGFFQGLQYMTPTAISQVADQVVRVCATIALSLYLRPRGLEFAVMGVAAAFILGELTGWLVLAGAYLGPGRRLLAELKGAAPARPESVGSLAARLIALAVPAVVATILWPVMQLADSLLVPLRLQAAGFGPAAIREGLGHLGMALTLAQFPNVVTVALATSLVPAVSEAKALAREGLVRHRAEEALRMALIFGVPSCTALFVLAAPISQVLFGYSQVAEPLRILAFGTVTLGIIQATTGVLQGLGAMGVPVRNLSAGVEHRLELGAGGSPQPDLRVPPGGQRAQLAPRGVVTRSGCRRHRGLAVPAPGHPGPLSPRRPGHLGPPGLQLRTLFSPPDDLGQPAAAGCGPASRYRRCFGRAPSGLGFSAQMILGPVPELVEAVQIQFS